MSRNAVEEALKEYTIQILDQFRKSSEVENEKKRMEFIAKTLDHQTTQEAQCGELIDAANLQSQYLERMANALEQLAKDYARASLK